MLDVTIINLKKKNIVALFVYASEAMHLHKMITIRF